MLARSGLALLAGLTAAVAAFGQTAPPPMGPPPAPAPVAPSPAIAPAPWPPPQAGATLGTPLPPPASPYGQAPPYGPAPLFAPADTGPFGLPSALPPLFFGADFYFTQPSIYGTLTANMPLPGGGTKTFSTPKVDLDFTASPRLVAGWRLPDNSGEFFFAYRLLAADGTGDVSSSFGPLRAKSRLNENIFDFDYSSIRYSPLPRFNVRWRIGIRVETAFFDNNASNAIFAEKASNYFVGAGPNVGLNLEKEIALVPGLALFGDLDGAVAIGQVQQKYAESLLASPSLNYEIRGTQSSPNATVQAGLSYTPPGAEYLRFLVGFQYERFWDVGKLESAHGDVQNYGGFIRAQIDF